MRAKTESYKLAVRGPLAIETKPVADYQGREWADCVAAQSPTFGGEAHVLVLVIYGYMVGRHFLNPAPDNVFL